MAADGANGTSEIRFLLNGGPVQADGAAIEGNLLDYVRSRGLTGAKEGCAEGECGACAVLLVEESCAGTVYRPVNSCLIPLLAVAGGEVYTVEALAEEGRLAEVQKAMAAAGGSQCGYCTPGFVVSMFAEQHRRGQGERDVHALGGNLCRCTGYRPIRDALLSLGPPRDGILRRRLDAPAPPKTAVGLAECLELLRANPAARLVAGNTDLGVLTNLRGERFAHRIDLSGVGELRDLVDGPDDVEIGAGLTLTEIEERWSTAPAVFHEWLRLFASVLIRNRATLGGNLATASPIGDSAPLLLALGAEVRVASCGGERRIPLEQFFAGYRQTVLARDEVIRSIRIPKPFPEYARFFKVAKRGLDDISTVAMGIAMNFDAAGRARQVRIGLGGVAAVPVRALEAERCIERTDLGAGAMESAREAMRRTLQPMSDHRGSAAYRLAMAQSLLGKFRFAREAAA